MLKWSTKTLFTAGERFQLLKTCLFSIRDTSKTYQMMKTRCQRQTLKTTRSIGTRSLVILLYSIYTMFSIFRNPDPVFQDLRLVIKDINAYHLNILEVLFWMEELYYSVIDFSYDNTDHNFLSLLISDFHPFFCTLFQACFNC